jgi:NADH-quinone oxidoreductase subunit H
MSLSTVTIQTVIALPLLLALYAWTVAWERWLLLHFRPGVPRRWGLLWPLVDVLRALSKPERRPTGLAGIALAASGPLALGATLALLALLFSTSSVADGSSAALSALYQRAPYQRSLFAIVLLDATSCLALVVYGWASGNPAVAQASQRAAWRGLAFGLPAWIALGSAAMLARSLDLHGMVWAQATNLPFIVYQPLGALLCIASLLCGQRRLPVQLPGPAHPLAKDFQLQHAGSTLAIFHLADYWHLLFVAGLIVTIYLGGPLGLLAPGLGGLLLKTGTVWALLLWLRDRPLAGLQGRLGQRLWPFLLVFSLLNTVFTGCALYWSH